MNKTCVSRNAIKCLKGKELAMEVQLLHVLSHSEMDWIQLADLIVSKWGVSLSAWSGYIKEAKIRRFTIIT